jgi:hypothetical protein
MTCSRLRYLGSVNTDAMVTSFARSYLSADSSAVSCTLFLSLPLNIPTSCALKPRLAKSSPEIVVQHADARGLFDGLIWPKTGFASIV